MEPAPSQPRKNRRASRRRSAKRSAQVVCYANSLGLGPNIALTLDDVSETGARVRVSVPLPPRQEIEINLSGMGHRRPVKILAEVIWCVPTAEGAFLAGLKFQRYLSYRDLQELGS